MSNHELDDLWRQAQVEIDDETDESPVGHLVALHRRPTREVFERALRACESPIPGERLPGIMVLRELGDPPRRFAPEALTFLLDMLQKETDHRLLGRIISAIGYQYFVVSPSTACPISDELRTRSLLAVIEFANHEDNGVRFHVAATLPGLMDQTHPEDIAVQALLRLAADSDASTRYYALYALVDDFGLTSRPDDRRTLQSRLNDDDSQISACARRALEGGEWGEPAQLV